MTSFSLLASGLFLLHLLLVGLGQATEDDVTPRLSFSYNANERSAKRFSPNGVFNYTSLLLSKEDNMLYVGARETLFALNITDISRTQLQRNLTWHTPQRKRDECSFKGKDLQTDCFNYVKILLRLNSTHLYVCGTYAFSPICAYINTSDFSLVQSETGEIVTEDGRSRCPFNPEYKSTAIMADGELYAGTVSNFQGNEPIIYKSLGQGTALKTENSLNWLHDPAFVGSAYIQESLPKGNAVGDDDKIYFFFSEAGKEFDFFDNTIVSRIARICKGDKGGERVLQKKWTTFLKAQLLCSLPDDGFPFNIIQDMFVLTPSKEDWKNTVFYGVFTSQWYKGASGSSAVCAFTMDQVEEAFNGRYREVNRETQQWYTYNHPVPEPRPGACITNAARAQRISSSLHMPDKVLNFVKDHFLMDSVIRSQPLMLKRNVRYTQLAVHRVQALHKIYDVLFIGTDDSRIHKAINVKNKMHIIEELEVFPEPQPIQHIELDNEKGLLFVSSYSGLVEIPLANCSNYQSCEECVLSRDPYCVWTGKQCSNFRHAPPKGQWQQDVDDANTAMCKLAMPSPRSARISSPRLQSCQVIQIPANTFTVLPCKLRSNLAERRWAYSNTVERFVYPSPGGGLVVVAQVDREEIYECWSEEEGYRQLQANYCIKAEPESTTLIGRSRTQLVPQGEAIILPGETWSPQKTKTYWNELIVVCALLVFSLVVLSLFVAYRNRDRMKSVLKEGECPNKMSAMQQKKPRIPGKHTESLPLNGNNIPPSVSDHKGYQTLNDNYICSTPTHECSSPENSKSFSESEKRPLNLKESHVEISPTCPRPRVRLGSEIKDSIV
ncbi:sema domain, immunoglobulin domain (Ig), transmembrane domain (TM) and short cytoplasmic domain, (semaphorin) 4Ba [Myxocyprinus asiaticus]|uniref:sema domain, immunoglobulin domain (Ig), transmembrane domain (TM) and short cytoplasmic domain, (semaphorin) 4Ba n=1 Tax=Myxocyprinus asiaticus TaxID=70543 RepID=UPI002222EACF|nr:sema domain, immunoglobulin domain (Ig), transmembrane domain (TM) and short cytoplasmic domain, (semaphorin) 4Ba [Myxocyprinus asiaticus]XP_051580585.1 sema domain, immunoglobulin domain (Ig), transmembrane domain (TM) and short cytoplasmic domain, (semaphorin) 4Ba [Myxocyprinus asiaticus]